MAIFNSKLLVITRGYSKMARDWDLGCSNMFQLFPSRDIHIIHGLCIAASMNSIDKAPCATWARAMGSLCVAVTKLCQSYAKGTKAAVATIFRI